MNKLRKVVINLLPTGVKRVIRPAFYRMKAAIQWVKRVMKAAIFSDYSQSGETAWLRKLVAEYECQQWIIDVGAHDGVSFSNSLPFVKRGWRAILIEPAPEVFSKLSAIMERRKNVTCLPIACSDRCGEGELFSEGDGGFGATLCKDDNEWTR